MITFFFANFFNPLTPMSDQDRISPDKCFYELRKLENYETSVSKNFYQISDEN